MGPWSALGKSLSSHEFGRVAADQTKDDVRKKNEKDNSCLLRLYGVATFDPLPTDNFWHESAVMWKSRIGKVVLEDFGTDVWTQAESQAHSERGYIGILRENKNSLLIAATLETLDSKGKSSSILTKLCDHILAFPENATTDSARLGGRAT